MDTGGIKAGDWGELLYISCSGSATGITIKGVCGSLSS